ncbi:MAG: DNA translocase FtsK 4TM domain-containing protein, partial [Methylococcaceae bacterium]|nr:DNA translocase FtsK 4TM domain-containing protein [Methylococcaceae bacterium]
MEEKSFRGLREIALLGFSACAIFFLISLVTFSNEDAGWTHSGSIQAVTNAGGVFGAWLADFMLSFFGLVAYLFPIMIFWYGYLAYRQGSEFADKMLLALNLLGSVATVVSFSALFYLHLLRTHVELPGNSGGILGQEVGEALLVNLGNSGGTLFLIVLMLTGITLVTGVSWLKVLDLIGKYTVLALRLIGVGALKVSTAREEGNAITFSSGPKTSPIKKKAPASPAPVVENTAVGFVDKTDTNIKTAKKVKTNYDPSKGVLPSLELLDKRDTRVRGYSAIELEEMSRLVEDILNDFNVVVEVVGVLPGPVITRFELQPAAGVKVSRISSLSKDLARALSVTSVRIVEVIPGKSVVGLEIPNQEREMVTLRELLVSEPFTKAKSLLTLAMGK